MSYKSNALRLAMTCLGFSSAAFANTTPTVNPAANVAGTASTPNDATNYNKDRLWWDGAITASATAGGPPAYCIPAGVTVVGAEASLESSTTNATASPAGQNVSVSSQSEKVRLGEQGFPYVFHWNVPNNIQFSGGGYTGIDNGAVGPQPLTPDDKDTHNANLASQAQTQCQLTNSDGKWKDAAGNQYYDVTEGQYVYVASATMANATGRVGWEYGALAVPFKMQLSKGKALTGSASLGPYLGFRIPLLETGIQMSPVAFAGASVISAPEKTKSASTTQNLAGLSYGVGLIFEVKSNFQVGLIYGADHVNPNSHYQYNDKAWLAFELGYSFAQ